MATLLTTTNNPYSPHHQWDEWQRWDEFNGYNTLALLGRVVVDSPELSQSDQERSYNEAADDIVLMFGGLYVLVDEDAKIKTQTE
jgi:hypothetical protein